MKNFIMLGLAAALTTVAPAHAATNLVTNGGFETTTYSNSHNFQFGSNYAPGTGKVTGWTSAPGYNLLFHSNNANSVAGNADGQYSGTNAEYLWASTASATGGNFVALDGDAGIPGVQGVISQMISGLTVGQSYLLSFEWGAAQIASRTGATTEFLTVGFGGNSFNTATLNNPSKGFTGWNMVTHSFTATSTSQLLSFLSVGTPSGLPPVALLDSVSLTAVPEPSTWALMLIGFGATGVAMRRRNRGVQTVTA